MANHEHRDIYKLYFIFHNSCLVAVVVLSPPRCRYFEDVRRAVMARLGRLSNDELAGEEEIVMTVMSLLGELMSVVDANFNVSD